MALSGLKWLKQITGDLHSRFWVIKSWNVCFSLVARARMRFQSIIYSICSTFIQSAILKTFERTVMNFIIFTVVSLALDSIRIFLLAWATFPMSFFRMPTACTTWTEWSFPRLVPTVHKQQQTQQNIRYSNSFGNLDGKLLGWSEKQRFQKTCLNKLALPNTNMPSVFDYKWMIILNIDFYG